MRTTLTLAVLLISCTARAAVLEVGPINLTGSGTFSGPDTSPYGAEGLGGQVISFDASGSNGTDSVTFRSIRDVPVAYSAVTLLPNPIFVPMYGCVYLHITSILIPFPLCEVTIDGMTGYGNFTQLGGQGRLQVYSDPLETNLIAEAQVNTQVVIKSLTQPIPNNPSVFQSTFDLVAPAQTVTHMPEPYGLMAMVFVGLCLCYLTMARPIN